MGYTRVGTDEVDPVADGMYFLREPLDTDAVGVTVVDVEAGWTGQPHDHADDDHEEVYFVIEGSVTVEVGGHDVDLGAGEAIRIDPGTTRQIRSPDTGSRLLLVGADK